MSIGRFLTKKLKLEWHQLYYLLGFIDILTILAALSLTQLLMNTYEQSVQNNRIMSSTVSEFSKLGYIAQRVNEPGNRVFETRDARAERLTLQQNVIWFNTAFSHTKKQLDDVFTLNQSKRIAKDIDKIRLNMGAMISESEQVFLAVELNKIATAGEHMSMMDAHFYEVSQAISDVSQYITDIQQSHFADQIQKAKAIKRYELAISFVVLVIIAFVTIYGHKLGKRLKENAKTISESLEAAQQSAKAKEMFLANMSHEIRTPMNAILGMLKLIDNKKLSKEDKRYLKLASSSADNLLVIINDILDLSKSGQNQLTLEAVAFNINDLLTEQIELYQHVHRERPIELHCYTDQVQHSWLKGDQVRLIQVINNLLNNAYKFTNQGSIVVHAATSQLNEGLKLIIKVEDTGIGIEKEKLASIFDEFSQADASTTRKYGGTGLGLAISKRISQLMGGDLSVTSEINKGSCFTATFLMGTVNIEECGDKHDEHQQATNELLKPLNLHLLVAEDNRVNQILIKKLLDKIGCTYDLASDGQQALKLLDSNHQAILMDCLMPIVDGFEATKAIRKIASYQKLPIIAVTANSMPEDRQKCIDAGMTSYISKPIEFDVLYNELSKIAKR